MRLRQVAFAARDLNAVGAGLRRLLDLGAPYVDPGVAKYGLTNQVFAFRDTFLEVVSPKEHQTSVGRLLDKMGGDCGYMVILQTQDMVGARARVDAAGVRVVDALPLGPVVFTHLHPKDVGGALLSLDSMEPPERWEWAGPDWRARAQAGLEILGVTVGAGDPEGVAERWGEVLGLPTDRLGSAPEIRLDGARIGFAPARGPGGVIGLTLGTASPDVVLTRARGLGLEVEGNKVKVCGVVVEMVPLPPPFPRPGPERSGMSG